ncbi:MAG TPA: response regulator [Steroidobacteraceae bacterium]|nr:response regulator [Steroidobacteraceae bacterium]
MNAWPEMHAVAKSPHQLSVLLVEDSRVLAERLRETLLSVPGVQLAGTVDSEAEAIAALQRHPVDVLLLDLHLRQGTGFGVLRALGGEQAGKLVVIVLTNYDLAEYRRAAAALGARHFLDKLRDFDRLPTLLQQIGTDAGAPRAPPAGGTGSGGGSAANASDAGGATEPT